MRLANVNGRGSVIIDDPVVDIDKLQWEYQ